MPFSRFILPPLRAISSAAPINFLVRLTGEKLLLPAYHIVSDEDVPHIKHLYPVRSEKNFRNDLDFFLKHYKPTTFETLQAISRGEKKISEPIFFLSFDDGLSEAFHVIAPILKAKGLQAAFFINSAFLDNKDLFFRYKTSLLIDRVKKKISLSEKKLLGKLFLKYDFSHVNFLKVDYARKNILDEAAKILEVNFDDYLKQKKPYLTSEQVNSLIQDGFFIGSHSIDHPEYRFISFEEQMRQTKESVDFIQKKFNLHYKIFAFPFTDYRVSKFFFQWMEKEKIADLSFGAAGLKKAPSSRGHLHRIPIEKGNFPAKNIVTSEYIYYLLKAPFGKNIIHRS